MSSSRPTLAAASRTETGKANARLRRAGRLPAVVFGHGDSVSLTLDAHDFELLRRKAGSNALIDLVVDGGRPTPVLVHGVQIHKVERAVIHVDLFRVKMTEDMTVDVAVHGTGTSLAVERQGGTLFHAVDHVKVRARPDRLPGSLEADLSVLEDFEAAIRARDLPLAEGVVLVSDPDEIVFRVLAPRVSEELAAGEAAEEPEAAAAPEEPAAE